MAKELESKTINWLETDFIDELLTRCGEVTLTFINDGFEKAQNPYQNTWEPLKESTIKQKGSDRILVKTGNMRDSFYIIPRDKGFTIANSADYFKYHQEGTNTIPQRAMIPIDNQFPPEWVEEYQRILEEVVKNHNE